MPRRRDRIQRNLPVPVPPIDRLRASKATLTASARIVDSPEWLPTTVEWQKEAWGFYQTSGELNFGISWFANAISRVRLVAAREIPGGDEPEVLTEGPAAEIVDAFGEDLAGRARLLYSAAVHLQVPGECCIAAVPEADGVVRWRFFSSEEIRLKRGGDRVGFGAGIALEYQASEKEWRPIPPESLVIKIWRPDERLHYRPDSRVRAALGILRELDLINRHIYSQSISRLASAGVLVVPDEMDFSAPTESQGGSMTLQQQLVDVASMAIKDPGSAASAVPIVVQVAAAHIEKMKHLTFQTPFDEKIIELRESTIRRLATALDMPAEVLLGLGDVNHWGAWQIEETGLKLHVDPTMELICHALTIGYLRPALEAEGESPEGLMVWYDDSELAVRPDKSQSAIELYRLGELSGEALRRETGFSEDDKPSEDEWVRNQLVATMKGAPTLFPLIAPEVGLMEVPESAVSPAPTGGEGPVSPRESEPDGGTPAPNGPPGTRDNEPPPPGPDTPG